MLTSDYFIDGPPLHSLHVNAMCLPIDITGGIVYVIEKMSVLSFVNMLPPCCIVPSSGLGMMKVIVL